jgi:hypothetical protein
MQESRRRISSSGQLAVGKEQLAKKITVGNLCFVIFFGRTLAAMGNSGGDAPFNFITLGIINCATDYEVELHRNNNKKNTFPFASWRPSGKK